MGEIIHIPNQAPQGEQKKRLDLPKSLFKNAEEAYEEVFAQIHSPAEPSVNRRLVDAILWLKQSKAKESKHLLEGLREKWIAPHAMSYGQEYQTALLLSDILNKDPMVAENVYRDLASRDIMNGKPGRWGMPSADGRVRLVGAGDESMEEFEVVADGYSEVRHSGPREVMKGIDEEAVSPKQAQG